MAHWMIWLILAGLVVILELFSGTFYLLMIAIGLVAGSVAATIGAGLEIEMIVAAVVGIIATVILRRSKFGKLTRTDSARDPNVNLDIGQTIMVDAWNNGPPGARPTARVVYRGALWDVELAHDAHPAPGRHTIREIHGSRLIVGASH